MEYFNLAVKNLLRRKKRTFLTILGIFIGISTFVSLFSLSRGLHGFVDSLFEKVGTNKIILMPQGAMSSGPSTTVLEPLRVSDVEFIEKITGVKESFGITTKYSPVEFQGEKKNLWIMLVPNHKTSEIIQKLSGFGTEEGRGLKRNDIYRVVIGHDAAYNFFHRRIKTGDKIKVRGIDFKVCGIMEKIGSTQDDRSIIMPQYSGNRLYNITDQVSMIFVLVHKGFDPKNIAERIKTKLKTKRGKEDFEVQTYADVIEKSKQILSVIEIFFIGIASISLLVGGIGIMNTMYTSIFERTREIGIMKSLGARNQDIMILYLIESGCFGILGGLLGVITGFALVELLVYIISSASIATIPPDRSLVTAFFSVLFSFVLGVISGVLPARRAANLNPVDALRYE